VLLLIPIVFFPGKYLSGSRRPVRGQILVQCPAAVVGVNVASALGKKLYLWERKINYNLVKIWEFLTANHELKLMI